MLCVFANARFSIIAERLLKWKLLGHLHFETVKQIDTATFNGQYRFQAPHDWALWKFGNDDDIEIVPYTKDDQVYHQTLKVLKDGQYNAGDHGVDAFNIWVPHHEKSDWSQPFVIHPLSNDLPESVFDITNWCIEMADSDTFEPYKPWQQ